MQKVIALFKGVWGYIVIAALWIWSGVIWLWTKVSKVAKIIILCVIIIGGVVIYGLRGDWFKGSSPVSTPVPTPLPTGIGTPTPIATAGSVNREKLLKLERKIQELEKTIKQISLDSRV